MRCKIYILFLLCCQALSANNLLESEARSVTPIARTDIFSPLCSAASLAGVAGIEAGVHYQNRFAVKELSVKQAQVAVPTKLLNIGAAFSHFGYENYNENIVYLSFARKFSDKFMLSAAVDYYSVYFSKSEGSKGKLLVQIGIASQPVENLTIGFQAFNPIQTNIKTDILEKEIPSVFSLGAGYRFSEKVVWAVQLDKEISEKLRAATEIEYRFLDFMLVRAGCTVNDKVCPVLGSGFKLYYFWLDANFKYHTDLGITSNIALTFKLKDK